LATVQLNRAELDFMLAIKPEYEKNMKWLREHYDELLRDYPEEYVAVYDNNVVGHSKNINDLLHQLSDHDLGIDDTRAVAIRKISHKTEQLFLNHLAV
jgi:phage anti-repressor protein